MRSLGEYIKESLLDDEDVIASDFERKVTHKKINEFLLKNYYMPQKYSISDETVDGRYVVNCSGDVELKKDIAKLTDKSFVFGVVDGDFICSGKSRLKSLEGSPREVHAFLCSGLKSLTSLKGSPKKVRSTFMCEGCLKLESLKGSPQSIGKNFNCSECNSLTSFEGITPQIPGILYCDLKLMRKSNPRDYSNIGMRVQGD